MLGDDLPVAETDAMIAVADQDRDLLVSYSDVLSLWHSVWGYDNGNAAPGEVFNHTVSFNRYK